jgi:hypothetical protein
MKRNTPNFRSVVDDLLASLPPDTVVRGPQAVIETLLDPPESVEWILVRKTELERLVHNDAQRISRDPSTI